MYQNAIDLSKELLQEFDEAPSPTRDAGTARLNVTTRSSSSNSMSPPTYSNRGGDLPREVASITDSILNAVTSPQPSRLDQHHHHQRVESASPPSSPKSTAPFPPPQASIPYTRDSKTALRQTQEEVSELRKALLAASEAVYAAQQELRVERQKRVVVEGERNRAVTGIRSLHSILVEKQLEASVDSQRSNRQVEDIKSELNSMRSELSVTKEHGDTLRQQLAAERQSQTSLLEDLRRSQLEAADLRKKLRSCREYARRKRDEVKKADAFVTGALAPFVREAAPFAAQWRVAEHSSDDDNDPMDRDATSSPAVATALGHRSPSHRSSGSNISRFVDDDPLPSPQSQQQTTNLNALLASYGVNQLSSTSY